MLIRKIALIVILLLTFIMSSCSSKELSSDPEGYLKDFIEMKFENMMKGYNLTSQMKEALSDIILEQVFNDITGKYGQLGGYEKSDPVTAGEYIQHPFVVDSEKAVLVFTVTLDADSNIAGFVYNVKQQKSDLAEFEKQVTFGLDEYELSGYYSLPEGEGPFPVVVLVHGSGPSDADETVNTLKPFRDIAYGLRKLGIATLRYDKRTFTYSGKLDNETITPYEETVQDALLAAEYAATLEKADSENIYILGHSLGGYLMPKISSQESIAKGFITLAAPYTALEDLIVIQTKYILNLDGAIDENDKATLAALEKYASNVKELTEGSMVKSENLFGIGARYWLYFKDYDPAAEFASEKRPVLMLQGASDYQVSIEDFKTYERKLGIKENFKFISYDNLNHLFMVSTEKGPNDYQGEKYVDEKVINDIASWISNN